MSNAESPPLLTPARLAEYRARYAERIAPLADPVLTEHRKAFRTALPASLLGLAGLVAVGWMFITTDWSSDRWWSDRDTLVRLALVAGIATGAIALSAWLVRPSANRQRDAEERFRRQVLPAAFSTLRPGARYEPTVALGEKWMRRSALVRSGNRYESGHEVRWRMQDLTCRLAHVSAELHRHTRDSSVTTVHFQGEVGVVDLPESAGGYVRVRARRHRFEPAPEATNLAPVDASPLGLGDDYEVHTSSPALAAAVLTPRLSALLGDVTRARYGIHLAVAHQELFVAVEQSPPWFDGLVNRFDEDHFLQMAETMDIVDGFATEVVAGLRSARASG